MSSTSHNDQESSSTDDGESLAVVFFASETSVPFSWGYFNQWDIPTDCTDIHVLGTITQEGYKFRRLLNLLQHDKSRRWSRINLADVNPCFHPCPAFLSLLVATFGKTDTLELPADCMADLVAVSCLNSALIMTNGLKALQITGSPGLRSFAVEQMTMFSMGLSSASRLKNLCFHFVSLSSDVARALSVGLERNRTLEHVHLQMSQCSEINIDPEALSSVIDSLSKCQTLRTLKLTCKEVLSTPVQDSIKRWLSRSCRDDCKLEELRLTHSLFPVVGTVFPMCTLDDLEQPNDSLTVLELGHMNLDSSSLPGILSNFRNLRTLDLNKNNISDLQPLLLENGLLDDTSCLERLVLDYNPISNGNYFAKRLPSMKVLRSIELIGVPFLDEDDASELFFKHVSMNTSLEYVGVTSNEATLGCMTKTAHTLHLNRAGRRHLGRGSGDLQLNLFPLMIERARRIRYYDSKDPWNKPSLELNGLDATFWLLRENSTFQSKCGG